MADPSNKRAAFNRLGWIMALIMFVIIGTVIRSSTSNPAGNSPSSRSEAALIQTPPPLSVSAIKLTRDYHRNEVRADSVYKGKVLAVSGTITSINKGIMDDAYLMIGDESLLDGVHAMLREGQQDKAAQLTPGTEVLVVCEGAGMIVGDPMLRDCVLQ